MDLLGLAAVGAAITAIIIGVLLAFTDSITWGTGTIFGVLFILAGTVWLADHIGIARTHYSRTRTRRR